MTEWNGGLVTVVNCVPMLPCRLAFVKRQTDAIVPDCVFLEQVGGDDKLERTKNFVAAQIRHLRRLDREQFQEKWKKDWQRRHPEYRD